MVPAIAKSGQFARYFICRAYCAPEQGVPGGPTDPAATHRGPARRSQLLCKLPKHEADLVRIRGKNIPPHHLGAARAARGRAIGRPRGEQRIGAIGKHAQRARHQLRDVTWCTPLRDHALPSSGGRLFAPTSATRRSTTESVGRCFPTKQPSLLLKEIRTSQRCAALGTTGHRVPGHEAPGTRQAGNRGANRGAWWSRNR